jgi:hypothetical protein
MNLPHYTDPYYESARQRRRYQTDPAYRLDRINRARKRLGLPPHRSLLYAGIRLSFERCAVDVSRLRRQRIVAGLSLIAGRKQKRSRRDRLTLLRKTVA